MVQHINIRSGYHQVEMDHADAYNTTFLTQNGCFRFKIIPFGMCNAPVTFQRLMNVVFSGLSVDVLLVLLDNIIVHSTALPFQLERLELLFQRLHCTELKLKISKCSLLRKEVSFLGHRISEAGVSTDPAKMKMLPTGLRRTCSKRPSLLWASVTIGDLFQISLSSLQPCTN